MLETEFTREQFDKIYPDGIGEHYWNHARNRIIGMVLKKYGLKRFKSLEIGCGRGVVLAYLRKKGVDCYGVELGDADPLAGIREFLFTNTDAFELPVEIRQSIDAVMLFDVLEHLENPVEFLQKIGSKFKNVKYVIITVPARQELWTNYDSYNGHFRRYSLYSVRELSTSGFRLLVAGYFNHILYPVFWIFARVIKKRGTDIKAPSGPIALIHRFISLVLQADFLLFPSRMPGTSIIAVFSRSD